MHDGVSGGAGELTQTFRRDCSSLTLTCAREQKVRAKCGDVCYCKKSKDPSCDEGACKVCFDKEVQPVQKRCHGLCREAYKTVKV